MPALNLFKRNADKPRLSIRERFSNAAARVIPHSRKSRAGGGTDPSRRTLVVGSLATVAVAPVAAMAAPRADAELLRLGQEHDEAFRQASDFNRRVATFSAAELAACDDDELDEICAAYTGLEFTIHQIPAETWAGVVVEARIAAEYAPPVNPETPILDDILASLINDILRIAEAEPKRHPSCT